MAGENGPMSTLPCRSCGRTDLGCAVRRPYKPLDPTGMMPWCFLDGIRDAAVCGGVPPLSGREG